MKKTIFTFVLALTAMTAGARVYVPGEDLEYEYNEEAKTATVVQCKSTWKVDATHIDYYNTYSGDIVIPETAPNGYTVVAIGDNAFQRLSSSRFDGTPPTISSVTIPKTVKKIGNSAFAYCDLLKSFTIPATVEEIGNCVFDYSGITTMTIEDAETPLIIGGGTFSDVNVFGSAGALTTVYVGRDLTPKSNNILGPFQFAATITDITYGPKVTKLNKHEFWRCKVIKNVKILSTQVTEIPEEAFSECSVLEKVELPQSIVTIQKSAFQWCNNLSAIVLPPTVKTIGSSAFSGCVLTPEFTIPASVEEIGNSAFNNSGITNLNIEDSDTPLTVSSYGTLGGMFSQPATIYAGRDITNTEDKGPFRFAANIVEITYGPKVTKLNKGEFWRCKSIKNVKILSTQVTEIPAEAFGECSALEKVELPQGIVTIQNSAFQWCNNLNSIVLPLTVKTIGSSAFSGCPLTPEFTIPASVEEIGNSAFNNSGITNLNIEDSDTPLTVSSYGTLGGMFSQPATIYAGRDITNTEDKGPFRFAANIIEITYGPKVTKLNKGEFWRCKSIKNVKILSNQITVIPEEAFFECSALESVILPQSIATVQNSAFNGCKLLNTIYANPVVPPTCGTGVFSYVDKQTCALFVPRGSLEDYKAAPVWKEFFSIEEMEPEADPEPTLTQGVLAVTRLADMNNARISHQILPTNDGFAVFGGHVTGFSLTRSAERYSTATGTWTNMEMLYPQDYSGSIIMPDGRLFIMGGMSSGSGVGASSHCEFYDPATNTFSAAASLVQSRSQLHATMSKSGKIYINGCWYNSSTAVECYDPETKQFTKVGEGLKTHLPFIFAMRGEKVVVTGGNSMVVLENGETTNVESELLTAYPIMKSWHETRMVDHQIADYSYVAVGNSRSEAALLHIYDDATEGIKIEKIADLPQTLPNDAQVEIGYDNEVTRVFCKPAERKIFVQTHVKGDGQRPVIVEYTFPSANKLEGGSTVVYTLLQPLENTIHDAAWASLADGTFVATGGGNSNFSPHAATYIFSLKETVQGDANNDGTVDVADIASVISVMASSLSEAEKKKFDMNGDGVVDVADISTIISIMAGK